MKLYSIIDENDQVIDDLRDLSLYSAERALCTQLNQDVECWIVDQE